MSGKYKIITLCGSMKFKNEFLEVQRKLTLEGNIVLAPEFFQVPEEDDLKQMLNAMHKGRIDLCDEIYVINKNGYIGNSTKDEIKYATEIGKKVNYLEVDN